MFLRSLLASILVILFSLQSPPALSQGALSSGQTWSTLNSAQKETLATLEQDWNTLSTEQKTKWIQLANKYEKLPQADRDRLKSRMSDWAKLSVNDRRIARANFIKSLEIPNDKKSEAWEAYQLLSPEEKKQLADEAAEKNKAKKRSLFNSPSLKN
jgi:Protein of unknown function (DUF3106)